MIALLLGPPGAGKTTLATKFITDHPEIRHFSIDEEITKTSIDNVYEAWANLVTKASLYQPCIVECAGTGKGFEEVLLPAIRKNCHIIVITAKAEHLYERLTKRPASLQLSPRSKSLEYMAIDYCSEILGRKFRSEKWLVTDLQTEEETKKYFDQYLSFVFQDKLEETK